MQIDPNDTLDELREAMKAWEGSKPGGKKEAAAMEHITACTTLLDSWLSGGGYLPTSWRSPWPDSDRVHHPVAPVLVAPGLRQDAPFDPDADSHAQEAGSEEARAQREKEAAQTEAARAWLEEGKLPDGYVQVQIPGVRRSTMVFEYKTKNEPRIADEIGHEIGDQAHRQAEFYNSVMQGDIKLEGSFAPDGPVAEHLAQSLKDWVDQFGPAFAETPGNTEGELVVKARETEQDAYGPGNEQDAYGPGNDWTARYESILIQAAHLLNEAHMHAVIGMTMDQIRSWSAEVVALLAEIVLTDEEPDGEDVVLAPLRPCSDDEGHSPHVYGHPLPVRCPGVGFEKEPDQSDTGPATNGAEDSSGGMDEAFNDWQDSVYPMRVGQKARMSFGAGWEAREAAEVQRIREEQDQGQEKRSNGTRAR